MVNRLQCSGGEEGNGQPLTELKQKSNSLKIQRCFLAAQPFLFLAFSFCLWTKGFLKNNFDYIFTLGQITFSDLKQRAFHILCVLPLPEQKAFQGSSEREGVSQAQNRPDCTFNKDQISQEGGMRRLFLFEKVLLAPMTATTSFFLLR